MSGLVSVVTTILNAGHFLNEAVESVACQRYQNWELILVDDGSTDNSPALAQAWCSRDQRIRLLQHSNHSNLGISASRNLGISAAHGELIAFLDADDVWLPGTLGIQVATMNALPRIAMAFGAAERWYSWEKNSDRPDDFIVPSAIPGWGADRVLAPPVLLNAFLQDEALTPCTCTVFVRKHCLTEVGGFENDFRGLYDDQVLFAKLALMHPVYVSSHCLARYRQHVDSCCAQARATGIEHAERQHFLNWLNDFEASCVLSH